MAKEYLKLAKKAESSLLRDRQILVHLNEAFGDLQLDRINRHQIETYRTERLESVTPATVNREVALVKHLFYQAVEWDFFAGRNPVKALKMLPEGFHRRALSEDQEKTLLWGITFASARPGGFSIDTGMRHGDILSLKWDEIDADVIRRVTQKRKRPVTIPLTERATKIVQKARAARETTAKPSPFVFVNPETGEPWKDLWLGLKTVCRKVGMAEVTWHSFRHTFCTRAARRADAFAVKQIARHADVRTTLGYVDVGMAELRRAVGDNRGDGAPESHEAA